MLCVSYAQFLWHLQVNTAATTNPSQWCHWQTIWAFTLTLMREKPTRDSRLITKLCLHNLHQVRWQLVDPILARKLPRPGHNFGRPSYNRRLTYKVNVQSEKTGREIGMKWGGWELKERGCIHILWLSLNCGAEVPSIPAARNSRSRWVSPRWPRGFDDPWLPWAELPERSTIPGTGTRHQCNSSFKHLLTLRIFYIWGSEYITPNGNYYFMQHSSPTMWFFIYNVACLSILQLWFLQALSVFLSAHSRIFPIIPQQAAVFSTTRFTNTFFF